MVGNMVVDCTQFTVKKAGMGHEEIRYEMTEDVSRKKRGMRADIRRQRRVSNVREGDEV